MHPLYRLTPVFCAVLSTASLAAPPASAQVAAKLYPSAASPGSASTSAATASNDHIGFDPAGFIDAPTSALAQDGTDDGLYLFPHGVGSTSAADMTATLPKVPAPGLASGAYATVGLPSLRITGVSTSGAPGYMFVGVTLTNTGVSDATNVRITNATLRTTSGTLAAYISSQGISIFPGTITANGGTGSTSLTFPGNSLLGRSGVRAILRIDGTFDGGFFYGLQGATTIP